MLCCRPALLPSGNRVFPADCRRSLFSQNRPIPVPTHAIDRDKADGLPPLRLAPILGESQYQLQAVILPHRQYLLQLQAEAAFLMTVTMLKIVVIFDEPE